MGRLERDSGDRPSTRRDDTLRVGLGMPDNRLPAYRAKRRWADTPEPVPEQGPLPQGNDNTFVTQLIIKVGGILYPHLDRQAAAGKLMASGLRPHTFHSYCYGLLRDANIQFALLDEKDLQILFSCRIYNLPLKRFIKASDPGVFLKICWNSSAVAMTSCELLTTTRPTSRVWSAARFRCPAWASRKTPRRNAG